MNDTTVTAKVPKRSSPGRRQADYQSLCTSTNPKDALGSAKLPLHLWPASATVYGALALLDGLGKYGRTNWRAGRVLASVYVAAAKRHLELWWEGQETDTESGLPHLAHALACLAILVDAKTTGTLIDDRQYMGDGYFELVKQMTPLVSEVLKRHSDKSPHHYTIADTVAAA